MSLVLQILILIVTLYCFLSVVKAVKKGKMRIEYAIIWVLVTFGLIIVALIPQICVGLSRLLGVISPVNFVFLAIIFILGIVVYILSLKISALEEKINHLVEYIAVNNKNNEDK